VARWKAKCQNLVGVLPGSDPNLKDEYVVLSAHLDHLGIGEPVNGDRIYNGAMDNASGVASLIEIAHAIKDSELKPRRSLLFLAVTGEEKFLLGSQYFATHPTVTGPIVANINFDCFLPLFPLNYLEIQGLGESSLGEAIREIGRQVNVEAHSEYEPDRILFIRSDQYNFIKQGVPALMCGLGYLRGSAEERLSKAWSRDRYHGPGDDLDQPVDLAAAAQFNDLMERLVLRVANDDRRPTWNPKSFFNRFVR
jgi:Zn-dependent M28 family amino/carboxypeptidase